MSSEELSVWMFMDLQQAQFALPIKRPNQVHRVTLTVSGAKMNDCVLKAQSSHGIPVPLPVTAD